ncbi:MAG: ABC transporter ATP-binding protein [Bacteroidales bacterium]|jgi:ABC-type multidrug transport system ATPase subunit|nr:ABC transporter ATP-binding protein [Bacteroidales bacterium]
MQAIEIKQLNKSYRAIKAIENISFSVAEGELFGLVGPDGAGKSTIFNILATLLKPDAGEVSVLGLDLIKDYLKIRRKIGYLPGIFSLYPDLTVEENLRFFAVMYKSSIKENMKLIRPLWDQLSAFKKRPAGKLSGGMKQKLALCCALIHKPELLFLDEPTTGVDPVSRKEFWDILNSIQTQNITVLVSTPYMDEASRCNRIALIQNGGIIKIETPQQIVLDFEGELFSMETSEIFHLLAIMEKCRLNCNYYPYGNHLHIAFYGNKAELLTEFIQFLDEQHIIYKNLEAINPSIEDCFIELINKKAHA